MVFHWSLSDSDSPQVSWTLLSILADLINALGWIVSPCPLIFKSSSPCTNPLVTVPSVPVTIGITITFMFLFFFLSVLWQSLCAYLSFRFPSVLLCGQSERQSPLFDRFSFFVDTHLSLLLLFILFENFSHQHKLMVFHWSLSDSKSPQVSRTHQSLQ